MTVFFNRPLARTIDFRSGDVGYVPQTLGHYIENTGNTDLVFLEMFKAPPIRISPSTIGSPIFRRSWSSIIWEFHNKRSARSRKPISRCYQPEPLRRLCVDEGAYNPTAGAPPAAARRHDPVSDNGRSGRPHGGGRSHLFIGKVSM